jgi:phosphoribosylanthranilate isomerase
MKMIVKVCGMRDADNIRAIDSLNIDMMGFIFYPKSPRYVSEKPSFLPLHSKRVGVFVNASAEEVLIKTIEYSLDYIQLHGNETPDYCRTLKTYHLHLIKAFSVCTEEDVMQSKSYEGLCDYYLFDTKSNQYGGSGKAFEWNILQSYQSDTPFLLSGGLGADDAEAVLRFHHKHFAGIDLNSRFEFKSGMKDVEKIKAFLKQIN